MTDKLGDRLSLKLSRNEPAVYGDAEDQVNTRYKHYTQCNNTCIIQYTLYKYLVKEKKLSNQNFTDLSVLLI